MLGFVEHEAIVSSYEGSSTEKQKISKLMLQRNSDPGSSTNSGHPFREH